LQHGVQMRAPNSWHFTLHLKNQLRSVADIGSRLGCFALAIAVLVGLSSLSAAAQQYHYSPYEKPDPFNPGFFTAVPKEALPTLQTIPLERLVLVGTLIGNSPSGLIATDKGGTNNQTYLVRVGDKIGIRSGTIVSILKDRIIIREPLEAGDTRDTSRFQDTAIMLRTSTSQTPSDLINDLSSGEKKTNLGLTEALIDDVMPSESSTSRATRSSSGARRNSDRSTLKGPDNQIDSFNNGEVLNNQPVIENRNPISPTSGNPYQSTFGTQARGDESSSLSTTVFSGAPAYQVNPEQQIKALDARPPQFGQSSQYQQGSTLPQTSQPAPGQSQVIEMQTIPSQSNPNIGIGGSDAPIQ
jgi:hypothetical protein